jgi:UDP-N-acetyl-2-amino-2-deoxyglucuronate dehydrogenase
LVLVVPPQRFAITGAAGYVAPRHLRAIAATGHRVVAALEPRTVPDLFEQASAPVMWFREERGFGEYMARLARKGGEGAVDYVAICSPSQCHESQVRLALEAGADVVCEKPVVLDPRRLDGLEELERASGRRVWSVLQMRLHPGILRLRESLRENGDRGPHEVSLSYVTVRGASYFESWKADDLLSGGLLTHIGIHFFDLLLWLFGGAVRSELHERGPRRASGVLELERAQVSWLLSIDAADLPWRGEGVARGSVHRELVVDGVGVDFSAGAEDLHTRLYEQIFEGRGFGVGDARPSLELVHKLRHEPVTWSDAARAPLDSRAVAG